MSPRPTSGSDPRERPTTDPSQVPEKGAAGVGIGGDTSRFAPRGLRASALDQRSGIGLEPEVRWPVGFGETAGSGSPPPLDAEMGAALEREILLTGEQEPYRALPAPGPGRGIRRAVLTALLLGVAASAAVIFLEERRTWKGKVAALEERIEDTIREAARQEEALRKETREKEREIAERKAETQRIATLAEKTLVELRSSLEDNRKLQDEKVSVEVAYRSLLEEQRSSGAYFLMRWLPVWLRENLPRPEATAPIESAPTEFGGPVEP